jgi:AICAR transformylase/IMP cyclohydrolase PurH
LANCKNFLAPDYDVFLVANDKFNMYATIAKKAGMEIVNQYKRPVLNRTEKDRSAYAEIIFHLKARYDSAIQSGLNERLTRIYNQSVFKRKHRNYEYNFDRYYALASVIGETSSL